MTDAVPYPHWAYFSDRRSADGCAAELAAKFDCRVVVDSFESDSGGTEWLLRAARSMPAEELDGCHKEMQAIVERHGGFFDGGESGSSDRGGAGWG
jgi:regulator of ribonuclease activity B